MRKYEVLSLASDGSVQESQHIAPATDAFEAAFSAFARGTMIGTIDGPCAIEDLEPGMLITTDGAPQPVIWIGRMTLVPSAPIDDQRRLKLTRIMADSFGLARPMPDLVLGHGARLLRTPSEMREMAMQANILTPARAFLDGMNVIEITPQTPVSLYHICLPHHAIIRTAGLEVESYHPGANLLRDMAGNTRALFLSLFPHIGTPDAFGPLAHPRAGQKTLEQLGLM
ncbi:Hint domain-containing protein [Rhodalgimonas zhirmunskyi]|uniref:Hint domain-containing protein n=1 Tax=Rhodalgimonas zhirmunskyi TaxID=2964767 RepID=A0AAJ1X676_9RHOB|nr:Hint domain-containing protein [Rhodoalgimonas zhirmunskyi]MDQ2094909.1 Hint domain-containing protein [Rhodoalgimonas zhirmunskyi]